MNPTLPNTDIDDSISDNLIIFDREKLQHFDRGKGFGFLHHFALMSNNETAMYDLFGNKYLWYCSPLNNDLKDVYGLGLTEIKNPDFFFDHLKKKDRKFVKESIEETIAFLQQKPSGERCNYKLLLDVSLKHPNGYHYRLVHRSVVVESDGGAKDWLVICNLSLLSSIHPITTIFYICRHVNSFAKKT